MKSTTKQKVIKSIWIIGGALAAIAACFPLEDGNLFVRGVMVLIPLAAAAVIKMVIKKI